NKEFWIKVAIIMQILIGKWLAKFSTFSEFLELIVIFTISFSRMECKIANDTNQNSMCYSTIIRSRLLFRRNYLYFVLYKFGVPSVILFLLLMNSRKKSNENLKQPRLF